MRLYRTGKMSLTSWGFIYFEIFSFHKNIKPFCGLISGIGEHPTTAFTNVKLFCSGLVAPEAFAEGSDAPSCRNVPCRTLLTCRPEEMLSTYWRAGLNFWVWVYTSLSKNPLSGSAFLLVSYVCNNPVLETNTWPAALRPHKARGEAPGGRASAFQAWLSESILVDKEMPKQQFKAWKM